MFKITCENCNSEEVSIIPYDEEKVVFSCDNCNSKQVICVVRFK